jgi:hypothetical protein
MKARNSKLGSVTERAADRGAIAIVAAILIPLFIVLCGITIDIGRWYVEVAKVQAAADAAALAGVTWMPAYFDKATTKALAASAQNGYTSSVRNPVTVMRGDTDSQLLVTVSSTIPNAFGALFGNGQTTIVRGAMADFQGSAPLGSPCNAFGNQPDSNDFAAANGGVGPPGTAIPTTAQGGHQTCQVSPQLWAVIQGPGENKTNGDRYATTVCSAPTDCDSNPAVRNPPSYGNKEYLGENYFWRVTVEQEAVGSDISLQLYDPAYVRTESACEGLVNSGSSAINVDGINPWAPDASERYLDSANMYCPGDRLNDSGPAMTTSFALRYPTSSQDPLQALPVPGCARQFIGTTAYPTKAKLFKPPSGPLGSYDDALASVFHQWVQLCRFTPGAPGEYYLQVRTNVANGGNAATSPPITTNLEPGVNGFAMRAAVYQHGGALDPGLGAHVAIAGFDRMPIRTNAASTVATFNLIQVLTNAASRSFDFSFFDVGDGLGSNTGSVQILYPIGAKLDTNLIPDPTSPVDCIYKFPVSGNLGTMSGPCTASIKVSTNDGKIAKMTVPIPSNYKCELLTLGSCWFRVKVTYPGSTTPTDTMTWDASIQGDMVRLVR